VPDVEFVARIDVDGVTLVVYVVDAVLETDRVTHGDAEVESDPVDDAVLLGDKEIALDTVPDVVFVARIEVDGVTLDEYVVVTVAVWERVTDGDTEPDGDPVDDAELLGDRDIELDEVPDVVFVARIDLDGVTLDEKHEVTEAVSERELNGDMEPDSDPVDDAELLGDRDIELDAVPDVVFVARIDLDGVTLDVKDEVTVAVSERVTDGETEPDGDEVDDTDILGDREIEPDAVPDVEFVARIDLDGVALDEKDEVTVAVTERVRDGDAEPDGDPVDETETLGDRDIDPDAVPEVELVARTDFDGVTLTENEDLLDTDVVVDEVPDTDVVVDEVPDLLLDVEADWDPARGKPINNSGNRCFKIILIDILL
jgi:hypothetical protein